MRNGNILISGASIAGPALAYWLSRHGGTPTVVERAPELRDGGYAVDFRGPAHLSVLERMGILPDVQRAHRVAFDRYEEQLRDYVRGCQKLADGAGGSFVPRTRSMILLRTQLFRILPYLPWKRLIAELPRKAASTITLRDYTR